MAFFEIRQYKVHPGKMDGWVKVMEEEIIPFQVSQGMIICGSYRHETDESVYFWIRRFESEEWCLANPEHPISFLRWAFRAHSQLRDRIRTLKPAALIRRGNRQVTLPSDLPEDKRQQLLSYLK